MPRRTYDRKKGRGRPQAPAWTDLQRLLAELERLAAQDRSHYGRNLSR